MAESYKLERPKLHSGLMELAVVRLLNIRVFAIIPNISWGLVNHECDLLALDKNNRFTEIEIKISLSDLRADFKKDHGHNSRIISRLIYAIPEEMIEPALKLIPETAGIITVKWNQRGYVADWFRVVRHDKTKKPSIEHILQFYRLGTMRIWSLKDTLYRSKKQFSDDHRRKSKKNTMSYPTLF